MKKLIVLFALTLSVLALIGCTGEEVTTNEVEAEEVETQMFEHIADESGNQEQYDLYRCVTTDVLYLTIEDGYGKSMTVLYSADGTPLTYDEWMNG